MPTWGYATEAAQAAQLARRPVSAFGLPLIAELDVITQQHFTYGINPGTTKVLKSSSASVVGAGQAGNGSDCVISIDAGANAFAIAKGFRSLHYRPGIGQVGFLTAAFNAGVANSQQFAGLWSPGAGFFVGYYGTTWGCFARTAGAQEVRTLTVTTAATTAANATITIDGTAVLVAVTNQTGNPSHTAWEIAQADYSAAGQAGTWGWDAYALGAVVYFVARRARVNSGTFSFSAGTTGSAATVASVRSGAAEVDDFGSPATPGNFTWLDALDGTGPSGVNVDKAKGMIYAISVGHLGHRGARFFFVNPSTGLPECFAEYRFLNTSATNLMTNPSLCVSWGIISNGSTTAMTMYAGSGMGALEGRRAQDEGDPWSVSASKNATSGTAVHYLSVRNGPVAGFGGQKVRANRGSLIIEALEVTVANAAATASVSVQVLRNPTQNNLAAYAAIDATRLAAWAWVDTTTTTATTSGGQQLESPLVNSTSAAYVVPLRILLEPGEVVAVVVTASAASMLVDVTLRGREIQ